MTLQEMSGLYNESAFALRGRITELRAAERQETDPVRVDLLQARIRCLEPMLREMRELSQLTSHYYDRSYRKHERYSL